MIKMSKTTTEFFRTKNEKQIIAFYDTRTKEWVVGVQGTSLWFGFNEKIDTQNKIVDLMNTEVE